MRLREVFDEHEPGEAFSLFERLLVPLEAALKWQKSSVFGMRPDLGGLLHFATDMLVLGRELYSHYMTNYLLETGWPNISFLQDDQDNQHDS